MATKKNEDTQKNEDLIYPRSSNAPVLVGDKVSANRLQSFIELTITKNDESFFDAIKQQRNLSIVLTKTKLREYFNPVTHNYMRDVEEACNHLMDKRIKVISGSKTKLINVFTQCIWDENEENIQIDMSYEAVCAYNYIEDNIKCLMYDGSLIRSFRRATSSFFYDIALRNLGNRNWSFDITTKELKEQFLKESTKKRKNSTSEKRVNCTDGHIQTKWLKPAFEELKEKFNIGLLDFYLEIAENGIHYETKETPGRKKIESFTINIVQLIPNAEQEINLIRQEILYFLQQRLNDNKLVYKLMLPWNSPKIDLAAISRLKKKVDAFVSLDAKGEIDCAKAWIISIMDPNKIHEKIKDSIISNSNTANSKWNKAKELIIKKGTSSSYKMIDNFVIHNFIEELNELDIQMISETNTFIQFLFNEEFYPLIKECIQEIFGNDVTVNIVVNREGEKKRHPYIETTPK